MMNEKDMAELIVIYDAYCEINFALFGEMMVLEYQDGIVGKLSRISNVIERNVDNEWKKDNYISMYEFLQDTSLSSEERAKKLLHRQ